MFSIYCLVILCLVIVRSMCVPVVHSQHITANLMEYQGNVTPKTQNEGTQLMQMSQILDQMISKTFLENPDFTNIATKRIDDLQKTFLNKYGPALEIGMRYIMRQNSNKRESNTPPSTKDQRFAEIISFVDVLFPGDDKNSIRVKAAINNFLRQNDHVIKLNLRRLDKANEIELGDDDSDSTESDTTSETESSEEKKIMNTVPESPPTPEKQGEHSENLATSGKESGDDSAPQGTAGDSDSDEPPGGGDGMGGGLLGLLAGLSGGEDGQSDLGSLLATVGGIVASLSGDGFDLNSLIASGVGLLAGLLSEGMQNPGAVVASYIVTTLESITGGGATNNGAFLGNFVSRLVKGSSAAGNGETSGEEGGGSDSASFFLSLIAGLSGTGGGH